MFVTRLTCVSLGYGSQRTSSTISPEMSDTEFSAALTFKTKFPSTTSVSLEPVCVVEAISTPSICTLSV